jgi:pyruvate dehydrogenase (quinone)
MSRKVADVLVETSQAAGVKRCYGIVGDTLNRIVFAIHESEIEWVHMRHEEAGAFAASAEAQFTGGLTACAGSCGPGSLHFINGLYEANRNRAPVILIATQVVRQDIGFNSIQEVVFAEVYKDCSVFCEMILTPAQARRKTVAACQAALTKRGVAVLVVPADISNAAAQRNGRMPSMPGSQSFAQVTPTLTKSRPFSTRVTQSRSVPAHMTRWSPPPSC